MTNLFETVIEHLVDSNFKPGIHEAYAFCVDDIPAHRIGQHLSKQLNKIDWDMIEKIVADIKNEITGQP